MNLRILVVDDDELVLRAVVRALRDDARARGLTVESANRAYAAFQLVSAAPGDRWFILTDHSMPPTGGQTSPPITGVELAQAIRALQPPMDAHIVMMSATAGISQAALAAGVDELLAKPPVAAELLTPLRKWLASSP